MLRRRAGILGLALLAVACGSTPATNPAPTPTPTESSAATARPAWVVNEGAGEPLDPALGNLGYDVSHYDLELRYEPSTGNLAAAVTMTATTTQPRSSINLDFVGFDVDGVTLNGAPATYGRADEDLVVRPPAPLAAGQSFTLVTRYHGRPETVQAGGGIPARLGWAIIDGRGSSYAMAEPDGARAWFPCNDVPADKATFTFHVTVPSPYIAAANGVLGESPSAADGKTWVWKMDEPMATYLATVVVSPDYRLVDDVAGSQAAGVPVRNFVPAGMADSRELKRQGEMIAYFGSLFGKFPFDAYGVAYAPGFPGAMETQTLTLLGMPSEYVVAHELVHSWFGDWVTPAHWSDVWLNEGFATYGEWLWEEHAGEASMEQLVTSSYQGIAQSPPEQVTPPGNPPLDNMFNLGVYQRGGLTLYALRERIGDQAFFATLREWVRRYGGASATTRDFIALAEEQSGADLAAFFDAWLYAPAMPPLPGTSSPSASPAAATVPPASAAVP